MKTIISILTIIGITFGAYFYIEGRYALCEDLKKVQQRLDYKIVSDQLQSIQERIWKIEDRAGKVPKDTTVKEELRQLEKNKDELRMKLDVMEKK